MNKIDMKILSTFWFSGPTIGLVTGAAITAAFIPNPPVKEDCSIYKISREVQTSYVMKPPPPEIIKEACQEAPKCPAAEAEPPKKEEQISEEDAMPKKKHRRRWRHRWR